MEEYERRERRFNESIPGIFANYARGVMMAEAEGKMAFLEFCKGVFAEPNLNIQQKMTIIDRKAFTLGFSVPAASVIDMSPVGIQKATIKMSITTSDHQESASTKDKDVATDSQTEITAGWGPVKVKQHIGIKARVSNHSEKKRVTDQTATTDAEMVIERQPVPETLSKIFDMQSRIADRVMNLNEKIIDRQIADAAEATSDVVAAEDVEPEAKAA